MPLIRGDVFYITVSTLPERTQLHVSANNDLLSTRLHEAHRKKNNQLKKKSSKYLLSDVRYSRGWPNEKNNEYHNFIFLRTMGQRLWQSHEILKKS